jgi:hypothetical protein
MLHVIDQSDELYISIPGIYMVLKTNYYGIVKPFKFIFLKLKLIENKNKKK